MILKSEGNNAAVPAGEDLAGVRVCAVIVIYHPDRAGLENLVCAVRSQVSRVLIVDNGCGESPDPVRCPPDGRTTLLGLAENIGLAAAQNMGIGWARARGFTHILFLDQDSMPRKDMVRRLVDALRHLERIGRRPAAVGPTVTDSRTRKEFPFVNFKTCSVKKNFCPGRADGAYVRADFLISSGMLAPLSVFEQAGMMDDRLFIDSVDMEWCFRVQYRGFFLYGICGAGLVHCLGDQVVPLGKGEKNFNIYRHAPLRQYYMMRNRVLLYRRYYVPMNWRIQDVVRMVVKIGFLTCFVPDKAGHLRMVFKGLWDGVLSRTGKIEVGHRTRA